MQDDCPLPLIGLHHIFHRLIRMNNRAVIAPAEMQPDCLERRICQLLRQIHRDLPRRHDFLFARLCAQEILRDFHVIADGPLNVLDGHIRADLTYEGLNDLPCKPDVEQFVFQGSARQKTDETSLKFADVRCDVRREEFHYVVREVHAVILDERLGGRSGSALIPSIRGRWPAARILILTADPDVAETAVEKGADEGRMKPIRLSQLVAGVEALLGR